MQKTAQKNDFSQGNIPATIARMAVPLIAAQLINVLYSVVDRIYIARIPHVGLTVLLVEQNAKMALSIADRAYVLETGRIVLEGNARDLLNNDEVKKAYLGN